MRLIFIFAIFILSSSANALYTEVGFSYSYMKRSVDSLNGNESQGTTGSLSFYFWEKLAIEYSYTSGTYVKKEKESSLTSSTSKRETVQKSEVNEANIIFLITDRRMKFQPYIKGGAAYIKKRQSVFLDGTELYSVTPSPAWGPSYGIGMKYYFTEDLSLRVSYDIVKTPIDESSSTEDVTLRTGFSWTL